MIVLRAASTTDIPALLTFWATAAENDARPADSDTALLTLIRHDPQALILAVETGEIGFATRFERDCEHGSAARGTDGGDGCDPPERIVGTVIAGFDGWRAHLYRLAVAPDRRRRGIGSALLERAEQRLRKLGAGRADAMVLDSNLLGRKAWAARSYQAQEEWSRWVRPLS